MEPGIIWSSKSQRSQAHEQQPRIVHASDPYVESPGERGAYRPFDQLGLDRGRDRAGQLDIPEPNRHPHSRRRPSRIAGDDHSALAEELPGGRVGILSPGVGASLAAVANGDVRGDFGWGHGVWRPLANLPAVAGAWRAGDSPGVVGVARQDLDPDGKTGSHADPRRGVLEWAREARDLLGRRRFPRLRLGAIVPENRLELRDPDCLQHLCDLEQRLVRFDPSLGRQTGPTPLLPAGLVDPGPEAVHEPDGDLDPGR